MPVPGLKATALADVHAAALSHLLKFRPQVIHAHELFLRFDHALLAQALSCAPVVSTPHSSGFIGDIERMKRRFWVRSA